MTADFTSPSRRAELAALYRDTLLVDVIPFWLRHGLDREHGGIITGLDRNGSLLDPDNGVWFQGRAVILNGEARPDVRTPGVWTLDLE